MHNAHPKFDRKALLVVVNRRTMWVCFWPNMAVVTAENPMYMKNLIHTSPVDSEKYRWDSSNH
jgi:hypothetical protein